MRRAPPRERIRCRPAFGLQLYSSKYNRRQKRAGLGVLTTYRRDPAWPESAFWAWELLPGRNSTAPVDGLTTINLVNCPSPACAIQWLSIGCASLSHARSVGRFWRWRERQSSRRGGQGALDHEGHARGGSDRIWGNR